jgi:hypothetical protein
MCAHAAARAAKARSVSGVAGMIASKKGDGCKVNIQHEHLRQVEREVDEQNQECSMRALSPIRNWQIAVTNR